MTEEEWLACDAPERMLKGFWPLTRATSRKFRLCSVALCRRLKPQLLSAERTRRALDCAERFADEVATDQEREAAWQAAVRGNAPSPVLYAVAKHQTIYDVGFVRAHVADGSPLGYAEEEAAHCSLFRCVFGNPFRTGADGFLFRPLAAEPGWLTSTVLVLAEGIYGERDFGAMSILADALQDAGCEQPDILNHCRDAAQVHARGCWVLDLVLEKERLGEWTIRI